MGYTTNESSVRVDIFKSTGKWEQSIAIDMNNVYFKPLANEALKEALRINKFRPCEKSESARIVVCLDPYHENSHPLICWIE